jgi:hypothetical protein
MAAGGLLVSSPILIHLINRMRFKRVRWAAMEFLLKSQKRNRRRLIIEQMILLLLRILLVLLAAFLVARFLYGGVGPRGAHHVMVIDDTLSMLDAAKDGLGPQGAYNTAIEQVEKVVRTAAQAPSAQNMQIVLLSELDKPPLFEGRLSDVSAADIDAKFAARRRKPTLLHVNPLDGLRKGRKFLSEVKGDGANKILHFVSDFRDSDWSGPDAEKLVEEVRGALKDGVNVNLIDVASPHRGTTGKAVLHHDNLALVGLKSEARVAIADSDIEMTATVMNYSQAEAKAFLKVYVNGKEDLARDMILDKLPPGSKTEHKFTLRFPLKKAGADIKGDTVEEREQKRRLEREFFHVRVTLRRQDAGVDGLQVDNLRDVVVEVRKKVPALVVDGNKAESQGEMGDLYHLQAFYRGSGVYEAETRQLSELKDADLDLYPSIFLLNVGEIPPALIPKLKSYVENGGSLCYFMGDEVKSDHYNTALFKAGLFPLQVEDRPYDPLNAAGFIDPEARKKERQRLLQTVRQPKVLFRDADKNLLVQRCAPLVSWLRYMSVNVYWRALPRSKWDADGRQAETPVVLPNAGKVSGYRQRAIELSAAALRAAERLAGREADLQRFVPALQEHGREIRDALALGELFRLAEALHKMLNDPGVKGAADKPRMSELWAHPEMKALAADIREFRDSVLYGDPLVVTRPQGKGRVVAVLTPAGTVARRGVGEEAVSWNNWAAGNDLVARTYVLFLLDLHRYLVSEGQAPNRTLGEEVKYTLDASRYDPKYSWVFDPQPDSLEPGLKAEPERDKGTMKKEGNALTFTLTSKRPGVYRINLLPLGKGPAEDRLEQRAYAYNIDAAAESDLKRAAEDRLKPEMTGDGARGKLRLMAPGADIEELKEKQPDASESPWLYLFFIIILVVEQAMAVHLSFHTKGNESASPGPLGHVRTAAA